MRLAAYKREISAGLAFFALLLVVGLLSPGFFSSSNLRDLVLNNSPVLLVAVGMTVVILVGEIDISVGSQFAVASVAAGWLAKLGVPIPLLLPAVMLGGAVLGAVNGFLVGRLRLPSIIVTLAMLVTWRDGLKWATEGAWVQDLPASFQWFGLGQAWGESVIVGITLLVLITIAWALRNVASGRAVYAVGSDREAARLAGIDPDLAIFSAFVMMGMLTGLASLLNAVRFSSIPSNTGSGLELKVIAAVVVGGTAITGGRGRVVGTLLGVLLLGSIGTALTFLGINPFWEKAIQGAIILVALISDTALVRLERSRETGLKLSGVGAK
jgi:rhamnose transport system permease protein